MHDSLTIYCEYRCALYLDCPSGIKIPRAFVKPRTRKLYGGSEYRLPDGNTPPYNLLHEFRIAHHSIQHISDDYTMTSTVSNMLSTYLLLFSLFGAKNQHTATTLAAVSAQCAADADLLRNNTELLVAAPTGMCTGGLSVASSCMFDSATISADYERVCVEEGGQFYAQDVTFDCKVTESNNTKTSISITQLASVRAATLLRWKNL
jgi:hypothetical protein